MTLLSTLQRSKTISCLNWEGSDLETFVADLSTPVLKITLQIEQL